MCKRVECPNDGKPTWWGCGGHIETALAGVPEAERCSCPHTEIEGRSGVYEVKKGQTGEQGGAKVDVGYEA